MVANTCAKLIPGHVDNEMSSIMLQCFLYQHSTGATQIDQHTDFNFFL